MEETLEKEAEVLTVYQTGTHCQGNETTPCLSYCGNLIHGVGYKALGRTGGTKGERWDGCRSLKAEADSQRSEAANDRKPGFAALLLEKLGCTPWFLPPHHNCQQLSYHQSQKREAALSLPPLFSTIFCWQKEASQQGACKNMFAISQPQQCRSKCRWGGVGWEKTLNNWQGEGLLAMDKQFQRAQWWVWMVV